VHIELLQNVSAVGFDRCGADKKQVGDRFVGVALRNQLKDFSFAFGQGVENGRRGVTRSAATCVGAGSVNRLDENTPTQFPMTTRSSATRPHSTARADCQFSAPSTLQGDKVWAAARQALRVAT
jgi:hypothetical protein